MIKNLKSFLIKVPRYNYDAKLARRAEITNLMILLSSFIVGIDLINSLYYNYLTISYMEILFLIMATITFILFKYKLSVQTASNLIVGGIAFLSLVSLSVEGFGKESAIFWTATLPLYFFFFLDVKSGLKWTLLTEIVLIFTFLNTIFKFYNPIFSSDLLIQLILGFAGLSYLFYHYEHSRLAQELALEKALKHKDILNQEVHHRVKNNLQFIVALLSMQAIHENNSDKYNVAINRIISLSHLHNILYDTEDMHNISTKDYFSKIADTLVSTSIYNINLHIGVNVNISISHNLFCGLLLNELITNSIKHSFKNSGGNIYINLKKDTNKYILSIKDDGISYNKNNSKSSFGTVLIDILVYDQLKGELIYKNNTHTIIFKDEI